jgi:hypothetical protein
MIKKFLSQNSKYLVIDFLLWLVVYPFVIAFAVACVAFIFSFSVFRDAKITDWISASCTIGILIGTWKAAAYAKKAAHQAQVQNNNVIISKIDDMQSELIRDIDNITDSVEDLNSICESIIDNLPFHFNTINFGDIDEIRRTIKILKNQSDEINIYKYRLFLIKIIKFERFNELTGFFNKIQSYQDKFKEIDIALMNNKDTREHLTENAKDLILELRKDISLYFSIKSKLSESINNKYTELNGCS